MSEEHKHIWNDGECEICGKEYQCFDSCPRCRKEYDEIDHEYQICSLCGYEAELDLETLNK